MAASQPNNGVFGAGIGYNTSIAGYIPINFQFTNGCGMQPWNGVWQAYLDGRRVINVSAEGIYGVTIPQTIIDAITEITNNGSVIVVSATNSGFHNPYSNIPGVINVSGMASDLNAAGPFDTYIDICAPSINVYRINRVNGGGVNSGTSLAAPIVAGTVALMLNVNPCLTASEIETLIKLSAYSMPNANLEILIMDS
jgi:subtilisin family serine protease